MSLGKPLILLPCEPVNPREIDPDFQPEREAAKAAVSTPPQAERAYIPECLVPSSRRARVITRVFERASSPRVRR